MTSYSVLAIFPAIAVLVAIYGLFADRRSMAKHLDAVSRLHSARGASTSHGTN